MIKRVDEDFFEETGHALRRKDHVGSLPQAAVITLIALKLAGVVTWLGWWVPLRIGGAALAHAAGRRSGSLVAPGSLAGYLGGPVSRARTKASAFVIPLGGVPRAIRMPEQGGNRRHGAVARRSLIAELSRF